MADLGARDDFEVAEDAFAKWAVGWDEVDDVICAAAKLAYLKLARIKKEKLSCRLSSCLINTCNTFVISTIVVMSIKHVRILCRLITWNVDKWNHSLVEALYTHVHDNNEHCTNTNQVYHMSNINF